MPSRAIAFVWHRRALQHHLADCTQKRRSLGHQYSTVFFQRGQTHRFKNIHGCLMPAAAFTPFTDLTPLTFYDCVLILKKGLRNGSGVHCPYKPGLAQRRSPHRLYHGMQPEFLTPRRGRIFLILSISLSAPNTDNHKANTKVGHLDCRFSKKGYNLILTGILSVHSEGKWQSGQ